MLYRFKLACCYAVMALALQACRAPQEQLLIPAMQQPVIAAEGFVASDGVTLPLKRWLPTTKPHAAIVALHGFNDYSNAFDIPGRYLSQQKGIAVYAYDQRGFGANPEPGIWGGRNLQRDLKDFLKALQAKHPHTPLFVLGESMGGAVAITACKDGGCPQARGVILIAPAVWGEGTMNILYRGTLWAMVHLFPSSRFTGEEVAILASDNIEMLRAMSRDPLIIKRTRVDAIYGIVNLMDEAFSDAERIKQPVLLLYGQHDEVIPKRPIRLMLKRLKAPHSFAYYPDGYHMLMRDLKGQVVMDDIATWVMDRYRPLPSGYDMGWLEEMMYDLNEERPEVKE